MSGFTERIERAFNVCLAADSAQSLQEEAGRRFKDLMDDGRKNTALNFGRLLEESRKTPLSEGAVADAWFRGIAKRVKANPASKRLSEILTKLSAYHEFEQSKLQVAIQSKEYNPAKHANDLFDAEQLIYLGDSTLCFLTCDTGFQRLVKKSPQAARIITVPPATLRNVKAVESLLAKAVGYRLPY